MPTLNPHPPSSATDTDTRPGPTWTMPPTTLSTAGRLVVLRAKPSILLHGGGARTASQGEEDVEAVTVDDALLRTVVYGDPFMHAMALYKRRVEVLATRAVVGGG
jgi:hypothetical protein